MVQQQQATFVPRRSKRRHDSSAETVEKPFVESNRLARRKSACPEAVAAGRREIVHQRQDLNLRLIASIENLHVLEDEQVDVARGRLEQRYHLSCRSLGKFGRILAGGQVPDSRRGLARKEQPHGVSRQMGLAHARGAMQKNVSWRPVADRRDGFEGEPVSGTTRNGTRSDEGAEFSERGMVCNLQGGLCPPRMRSRSV